MKYKHNLQIKIENIWNSIKGEIMQKQNIIATDNKLSMKSKS